MSLSRQADFGGGIFRSPRAPQGSVYDAVDGLIDEELAIYRRGGSAVKSNADIGATPLQGLAAESLLGGERTVFWTSTGIPYRLQVANDATPEAIALALGAPFTPRPYARGRMVNGLLAVPSNVHDHIWVYGGSEKAASYLTGTVSVAANNRIVTGVGTAWLANVDAGMPIILNAGRFGVVSAVTSNTTLELQDLYPTAVAGGTYVAYPSYIFTPPVVAAGATEDHYIASVGTPQRLVMTHNNRAYFSLPDSIFAAGWSTLNYHEIDGTIIGADAVRDTLILFATTGVWLVTDMNLDLVDANGNAQQRLTQISKDIILWDDSGIAGLSTYAGVQSWSGQLIVPARDDVYIFGVDSPPIPISRGIRPLYRSYVQAGYKCGTAELFSGHYFLPIRNGDTLVDTLVCRLDQRDSRGQLRPGWTRLANDGLSPAFAARRRPGLSSNLFSLKGQRVMEMTGVLVPSAANKNEAGGTTHNLDITLNDHEPGSLSTLQKVRVSAEIVDAASDNPTLAASYAVDAPEGTSLTALSGVMAESTDVPKNWRVVKRGRRFRLRLLSSGAASKLRVRMVEWFVRDSNRP